MNLESLINQRNEKLRQANLIKKQITEAKHAQPHGSIDALRTVEAEIAELTKQIEGK